MKIQSYQQFISEAVGDDKSNKPQNLQKPSAIKRFFGLDKLSDYKILPTSSKPNVGNQLVRNGKFRLCTISAQNPTPERVKDLQQKGWTPVWTETVTNKTKLPPQQVAQLPPLQVQFMGSDYFDLGGFKLNANIQDILTKEFSLIPPTHQINTIQIESCTDKVRVTDNLKQLLQQSNYSADNKGLSQARADAIKNYLISVGGDKLKAENFLAHKLLFEQGKEITKANPEGDATKRYVKLNVTLKPKPAEQPQPTEETTEMKIQYFQKMFNMPRPCGYINVGPAECFTYS